MKMLTIALLIYAALFVGGCSAITPLPASAAIRSASIPIPSSATEPSAPDPLDQPHPDWSVLDKIFGVKGELKGDVYTISLPRDDLNILIDGMPVPSNAACSEFHFYRCECGKMSVAGEFCLVDYEANDVIDSLRAGGFRVAAQGNLFISAKPPMVILRFQGEARGSDIFKPIQQAFNWIGPARTQPAKAAEAGKAD